MKWTPSELEDQLIRHIVAFRLSSDNDAIRRKDADDIRTRLEALSEVVSGIINIRVRNDLGLNPSHWHLVLVADYVDNDALESYQTHPRHTEVVEWMKTGMVADRMTIDFEVS